MIVDIAVPGDTRIKTREQDKILKYQDLKREIKKLWNLKSVKVVPIVVGALGAVSRTCANTWIAWTVTSPSLTFRRQHCLAQPASLEWS